MIQRKLTIYTAVGEGVSLSFFASEKLGSRSCDSKQTGFYQVHWFFYTHKPGLSGTLVEGFGFTDNLNFSNLHWKLKSVRAFASTRQIDPAAVNWTSYFPASNARLRTEPTLWVNLVTHLRIRCGGLRTPNSLTSTMAMLPLQTQNPWLYLCLCLFGKLWRCKKHYPLDTDNYHYYKNKTEYILEHRCQVAMIKCKRVT